MAEDQKRLEDEKMKQLRIIAEQNRAKKNAQQASSKKPKQNDYALPLNYQQDFLAQDGNMQVYGQKQVINGPSKTGGATGGLQVHGS